MCSSDFLLKASIVSWQGIIVTGITYWLQVWAIEKKGPVFTAMFTPLALIITAIFSALIWKEALHWGRYYLHFYLNHIWHSF